MICYLQRQSCVEKARKVLTEPTNVTLNEYVPDTFLCSGGSSAYQDAIACKGLNSALCDSYHSLTSMAFTLLLNSVSLPTGDSGGSLFLQKRKRYFQVSKCFTLLNPHSMQ